jgi:hypothetical protein
MVITMRGNYKGGFEGFPVKTRKYATKSDKSRLLVTNQSEKILKNPLGSNCKEKAAFSFGAACGLKLLTNQ